MQYLRNLVQVNLRIGLWRPNQGDSSLNLFIASLLFNINRYVKTFHCDFKEESDQKDAAITQFPVSL